jgi:hypothetical protein
MMRKHDKDGRYIPRQHIERRETTERGPGSLRAALPGVNTTDGIPIRYRPGLFQLTLNTALLAGQTCFEI